MDGWRKETNKIIQALDDFAAALEEMDFPNRIKDLLEDTQKLVETHQFIPKEDYLNIVERLEALAPLEEKARDALQVLGGDFGEFSLFEATCHVINMLQHGTKDDDILSFLSEYLIEEEKEIEIFGFDNEEVPEIVLTNPGEIWDYLYDLYTNE